MVDEVSGNIVAELRNIGTFGGFSEESMQLVLEGMWNTVDYALKDSRKMAGQLEECSDSKVMQSVLNVRPFEYNFGGFMFHMLPQSHEFSHGLSLNNFLQVWLICNQRDQVPPFRYINCDDEVSNLVRLSKLLQDMKYLMSSVRRSGEALGIWNEENWDVKRVNSLCTIVSGKFGLKRNKRFDSLIWSYLSVI